MVETFKHVEVATSDLLAQLRIPHVAHWSFGERLAVIEEGTSDPLWIGHAFETLAAVVAHRTERTELLIGNRESYVDTARSQRGRAQKARDSDVFVAFARSDARFGRALARELRQRGLRVADDAGPVRLGRLRRARNLAILVDRDGSSMGDIELEQFLSEHAADRTPRRVFPVLRGEHARTPKIVSRHFAIDARDSPPSAVADRIAMPALWQRFEELLRERGIHDSATLTAAGRHASLLIDVGELDDARTFIEELESEIVDDDAQYSFAGYEVLGLRATLCQAGADRLAALEVRRRQLASFDQFRHADTRAHADAKLALADALVDANQYDEALTQVTEAHALLSHLLGSSALKTFDAQLSFGRVLAHSGDSEQALDLLTGLWNELERKFGATHKLTLKAQSTLAEARCMAGDLAGGLRLQRHVVEVRTARSDRVHELALEAKATLADMLEAGEATDESVALRESVADGYQQLRGSARPETLRAEFAHARAMAATGDTGRAVDLVREVLEIAVDHLSYSHPVRIDGYAAAGAVLRTAGLLVEAAEVLHRGEEAVARLDVNHPLRLSMLDEIATTQERRGYFEGARKLREQILISRTQVLGEGHSQTLMAMSHLAMTLAAMGDFEAALRLDERVVSSAQLRFGRADELVVRTKQHLAQTLDILGRTDEAEWLLVEVMRTLENDLGEAHLETQRARLTLGDMLMRRGAHERALSEIRRAAEVMRATLGPTHPETFSADALLGVALNYAGHPEAAESELSTTFEQMAHVLGPDHPRTLSTAWAWFGVLRTLARHDEALEVIAAVVAGRSLLYGDTHPSTVDAMQKQVELLDEIGDRSGAEAIRRRIAVAMRTPPLV
ncbi:toll/interleukin-1 receptor domain-containing protein [Solirubrobacter pauli]|nr:toll/interleukin-1 receptor domain-containing protein [Solirubrobacter pauli]